MGCTSSNSNKNKRESLHHPTRDSTFEETNQLNTDLTNDDEVIGDMRPSISKKEMRKEQEKLRDAEIR